jgi:hypothetical protein
MEKPVKLVLRVGSVTVRLRTPNRGHAAGCGDGDGVSALLLSVAEQRRYDRVGSLGTKSHRD